MKIEGGEKMAANKRVLKFSGKQYPEELTMEQFDRIKWDSEKQFGLDDDRPNNPIAKDVWRYAKKTKGQIYTLIDGDGKTVYSRGMRFVNRIGLWEVVKKSGYEVDNS